MYVEGMWLLLSGSQFTAQILVVRPKSKLISVLGVVAEPIIDIVIRNAGASAEGNLAAKVRKQVESVVVMVLGDG